MSPKTKIPELVGLAEVADILKLSKQRANQLASDSSFPAPVAVLRCGPIWVKTEVDKFAANRRPAGRPKTA